ncbi:hypothetical protein MAPG_10253 [Magnaporthiopsis poae ATCC 64411]|uniref:Uncharacterized protein n=1 Tax=Magnaporthiopsis poae (strain ATCC 64411 / 73-15) TaxID=644358 RepID=A0A0C4EC39_MAGP6|nr:hypothetical protein MAPG_10253 [Magnaporthiopsis poae ATCC 64411]
MDQQQWQKALVSMADHTIGLVQDAPVPQVTGDNAIVKVKAVAVNLVDAKMVGHYVTPGATASTSPAWSWRWAPRPRTSTGRSATACPDQDGLRWAVDCISNTASMQFCYQAISRLGGRYVALEPYSEAVAQTRKIINPDFVFNLNILGEARAPLQAREPGGAEVWPRDGGPRQPTAGEGVDPDARFAGAQRRA